MRSNSIYIIVNTFAIMTIIGLVIAFISYFVIYSDLFMKW